MILLLHFINDLSVLKITPPASVKTKDNNEKHKNEIKVQGLPGRFHLLEISE